MKLLKNFLWNNGTYKYITHSFYYIQWIFYFLIITVSHKEEKAKFKTSKYHNSQEFSSTQIYKRKLCGKFIWSFWAQFRKIKLTQSHQSWHVHTWHAHCESNFSIVFRHRSPMCQLQVLPVSPFYPPP